MSACALFPCLYSTVAKELLRPTVGLLCLCQGLWIRTRKVLCCPRAGTRRRTFCTQRYSKARWVPAALVAASGSGGLACRDEMSREGASGEGGGARESSTKEKDLAENVFSGQSSGQGRASSQAELTKLIDQVVYPGRGESAVKDKRTPSERFAQSACGTAANSGLPRLSTRPFSNLSGAPCTKINCQ